MRHVIVHLRLAVAHAIAQVHEVRREVHVLEAAGDGGVQLACADRGGRLHHGLQARAAHLVHGDGAEGLGKAREQSCLTRRVLSHARLQHVAHDALLDGGLRGGGGGERGLDRERAKLRRGDLGERASELSDGRATGGDDDGVAHGGSFSGEQGMDGNLALHA